MAEVLLRRVWLFDRLMALGDEALAGTRPRCARGQSRVVVVRCCTDLRVRVESTSRTASDLGWS